MQFRQRISLLPDFRQVRRSPVPLVPQHPAQAGEQQPLHQGDGQQRPPAHSQHAQQIRLHRLVHHL
ncbi:hypothetical protein ACEWB5_24990, partial [Citrobacter koseri]|uniref:hypothetical protein n=1 Tax=Citrobacter koseri TaxID=545 RepID=UPI00398A069A